jgi:hypothetical protein
MATNSTGHKEMIDTWLKNDLKSIYATHPIVVLIDESGDANFLLRILDSSNSYAPQFLALSQIDLNC